jgi:poly(hydroxyalkanoate) depolymerase family esterase
MSGSFLVQRLRDQTYWLHLPASSETSASLPLIVMLHGCGQTAAEFAQGTRMNQQAQGCVMLYPEQSRAANSMRCWNWFEPEALAGGGEAAMIVQLIRDAQSRHPIDPSRCYVVGLSAGACMAALLCSAYGNLFAGCAMHSGLMAQAASSLAQAVQYMRQGVEPAAFTCSVERTLAAIGNGAHTTPTLIIHGSTDAVVNPVNAQQIAEQLRLVNTRPHAPAAEPVFDSERWIEGSGRPYRQQQMSLEGRLLLRTIMIEGLGHAWSGGDPRHDYFDPIGPDATGLILDFLQLRAQQRPRDAD